MTTVDDLEFLSSATDFGCDVLEYRLDDLSDHLEKVKSTIIQVPLPTLITVRCPNEGGQNNLPDAKRLDLYSEFLPLADLIDVEIETLKNSDAFQRLLSRAQDAGVLVVGSFHNFSSFAGLGKIEQVLKEGNELGVDIVKMAMVTDTLPQVFEMSEVIAKFGSRVSLSLMGMGKMGKISRLVLARSGSCLNYGYLQTENAPGQWKAQQLRDLISEI